MFLCILFLGWRFCYCCCWFFYSFLFYKKRLCHKRQHSEYLDETSMNVERNTDNQSLENIKDPTKNILLVILRCALRTACTYCCYLYLEIGFACSLVHLWLLFSADYFVSSLVNEIFVVSHLLGQSVFNDPLLVDKYISIYCLMTWMARSKRKTRSSIVRTGMVWMRSFQQQFQIIIINK